MQHNYSYQSALAASERINWKLEDLIGGAAGEGVADYLIAKSLKAGTVPDWVTAPYRRIHQDEEEHGNYPLEILAKYATTPELQDKASRAVAMSLVLRRAYFDNLDQWVFENKSY